jgi:hypothetical protein
VADGCHGLIGATLAVLAARHGDLQIGPDPLGAQEKREREFGRRAVRLGALPRVPPSSSSSAAAACGREDLAGGRGQLPTDHHRW